MATINFSVPDEVKADFNRLYAGENKSAVLTRLMRQAIEEKRRRVKREAIFRTLTERRAQRPAVTAEECRQAREQGRP